MPTTSRWFIKAGVIYFVLGITLVFLDEIPLMSSKLSLLPIYLHMLVMGWITQLIIGVSVWMFPRKHRDKKRRESILVWATFWTLNIGLILRFLSEPFIPLLKDGKVIQISIVVSALLQWIAVILYTIEIWPRLQNRKKQR
ncbi:NnrS family protein [Rhodohalobacter barkolensis]|uniref:Uncharacterized protein n=1 Tax=Rhodohalobacter barkolensis TaxID=2053187 RepID=A0A2N0VJT3_9BACT|nr:NnrS family protein [Rhodohalobacter barkolensis]PKD44442.1 hypothetical protein CWD77_02955 [Rhodohalobacter barkolensis]